MLWKPRYVCSTMNEVEDAQQHQQQIRKHHALKIKMCLKYDHNQDGGRRIAQGTSNSSINGLTLIVCYEVWICYWGQLYLPAVKKRCLKHQYPTPHQCYVDVLSISVNSTSYGSNRNMKAEVFLQRKHKNEIASCSSRFQVAKTGQEITLHSQVLAKLQSLTSRNPFGDCL